VSLRWAGCRDVLVIAVGAVRWPFAVVGAGACPSAVGRSGRSGLALAGEMVNPVAGLLSEQRASSADRHGLTDISGALRTVHGFPLRPAFARPVPGPQA
jgi:hypothetical protein